MNVAGRQRILPLGVAPADCQFVYRPYKFGPGGGHPWRRMAEKVMFEGHDPYLVALSVVIAILGGYTGFGLADRKSTRLNSSHGLLSRMPSSA